MYAIPDDELRTDITQGYMARITPKHLDIERFETSRSGAKSLRTRYQL